MPGMKPKLLGEENQLFQMQNVRGLKVLRCSAGWYFKQKLLYRLLLCPSRHWVCIDVWVPSAKTFRPRPACVWVDDDGIDPPSPPSNQTRFTEERQEPTSRNPLSYHLIYLGLLVPNPVHIGLLVPAQTITNTMQICSRLGQD